MPTRLHMAPDYYICSVILEQLESFRNYQNFSILFPKILDAKNLKFCKGENFSDSSFHPIFESEKFRFPFSAEKKLNLGLY